MSKVLTFSTVFPSYHPRKGEPTYFVEKVIKGLIHSGNKPSDCDAPFIEEMYYIVEPKFHTIRKGKRWKVGDKFSPRIWSGKPYASKQIIIADDIELKKVWDFEKNGCLIKVNDKVYCMNNFCDDGGILAMNDGLSVEDMQDWFNKDKFDGQIICWSNHINY